MGALPVPDPQGTQSSPVGADAEVGEPRPWAAATGPLSNPESVSDQRRPRRMSRRLMRSASTAQYELRKRCLACTMVGSTPFDRHQTRWIGDSPDGPANLDVRI